MFNPSGKFYEYIYKAETRHFQPIVRSTVKAWHMPLIEIGLIKSDLPRSGISIFLFAFARAECFDKWPIFNPSH